MIRDLFTWSDEQERGRKVVDLETARCRLRSIHVRLDMACAGILRAERRAAGLELPATLLILPSQQKRAQSPPVGQREACAS